MPRKDLAERRLGDQRILLAAMPLGQPVKATAIVRKTGFSLSKVGALLNSARKDRLVEWAERRREKNGKNWQFVQYWRRLNRLEALNQQKPAAIGLDAEDLQWMAYWSERYRERLRRQLRIQQREAQCRSICNF